MGQNFSPLEPMRQCRCNVLLIEQSISRKKNSLLPFEKFPILVLARNTMLPHLIIHSSLHYLSTGRLRDVKKKENFTRGSKYSDLTCKLLLFWKTGRWGEMVATGASTVLPSASGLWRHFQDLGDSFTLYGSPSFSKIFGGGPHELTRI